MDTRQWLETICSSKRSVAHFIALLAELEGIGAHKIHCAILANEWGDPEQKHLGEESKHAILFEKLLQHPDWRLADSERTAMRELAHDYFQPLDHGTADHLNGIIFGYSPRLCYLLVSYLIECRALEVYAEFYAHCPYAAVKKIVKQVIVDEKGHLASASETIARIFEELGQEFSKEEFSDLEAHLYRGLQQRFLTVVLPAPAGSSVAA